MITRSKQLIREFYDVRSAIYSMMIFCSLLFLINLQQINGRGLVYVFMLGVLILVSLSEFLFSVKLSAKLYHQKHPLRQFFVGIMRHHFYNILLLPIMQYLSCAVIIYFDGNIGVQIFSISVTSFMSYLLFYFYSQIYTNGLKISQKVHEFFDASKFVSFTFFVYAILLILQNNVYFPRSFASGIIAAIGFILFMSVIWRRKKLNIIDLSIPITFSFLLGLFTYFLLVNFNYQHAIITYNLTAQILVLDYIFTSLTIRFVEKRLTWSNTAEYILVALCCCALLFFAR